MSDDLFSRLFELFNQPGPVNWKLGAEVARHLAGEREPVEPWAAEEFRELARLAEYRIEQIAPFRISPATDVLPVDRDLEAPPPLRRSDLGEVELGPAVEERAADRVAVEGIDGRPGIPEELRRPGNGAEGEGYDEAEGRYPQVRQGARNVARAHRPCEPTPV